MVESKQLIDFCPIDTQRKKKKKKIKNYTYCPLCDVKVNFDKIQNHMDFYCSQQKKACPICQQQFLLEHMDAHVVDCVAQNQVTNLLQEEEVSEYGSEYGSEYESEEEPEGEQQIQIEQKSLQEKENEHKITTQTESLATEEVKVSQQETVLSEESDDELTSLIKQGDCSNVSNVTQNVPSLNPNLQVPLQYQVQEFIKCTVCALVMPSYEIPDHAIAHTVHQKIIEKQHVQTVAEVNQFWEDEQLEVANSETKVRVLKQNEIDCLPVTKYGIKQIGNGRFTKLKKNTESDDPDPKCMICLCQFQTLEKVRTLRCLHIFHKDCIDEWLSEKQGTCAICRVVQILKKNEEKKEESEYESEEY